MNRQTNEGFRPTSELATQELPSRLSARQRLLLAVAGGVGCLLIAATVYAVATQPTDLSRPDSAPGSSTPAATSTHTPTPTPTPASSAPPEQFTDTEAELTIDGFLATVASAAFTADDLGVLEGVAAGAILEEIRSEQLELDVNGWTKRGEARVESVTVVDMLPDAAPPTATVTACVDSSDVRFYDSANKPLFADAPTSPRALNTFTLTLENSAWRVTSRTFPDNPTC